LWACRWGLRRAEIASLKVGDLHQNRGFDSLRIVRKGGRRDALAINPATAQRIRAYLEFAGHADDLEGPLFRPLSHNGKRKETRRAMDPDAIDRVLRKHATALSLDRGYSAHSMRATFINASRGRALYAARAPSATYRGRPAARRGPLRPPWPRPFDDDMSWQAARTVSVNGT
jgi:integrase